MRVPVLVLDDGFALTDSHLILDGLVPVSMVPRDEPDRHCVLKIAALGAARLGPWWFDSLTHADIMVACGLRFVTEALPGVVDL